MSNLLDCAEEDVEMVDELAQLRSEEVFGASFDIPPNNFANQSNIKQDKISFVELING